MKYLNYILPVIAILLTSCSRDDNGRTTIEPPRDEAEVYEENIQEIETFLKTHFYTLKDDATYDNFKNVVFDTIAGDNSGKTPLFEEDVLKSKTYKQNDTEYKIYYLQIEKGNEDEYQPTFADKVTITYKAQSLQKNVFKEAKTPKTIDLPVTNNDIIVTRGFIEGLTEFKGGSGFTENPDGSVLYEDDFGIGAVFVPSGLSYFNNPVGSLHAYSPFVVSFQLFKAIQMDHDGDGIPSFMEDLNGNHILGDDDTDGNGIPNFQDPDDDGDGKPTKEEIIIHPTDKDWLTPDDIELIDSNNSGTPDYLDPAVW